MAAAALSFHQRGCPSPGFGSMNGFTYISALVFVVIMGIVLHTAGGFWSAAMKREREQQLLFAGDQIRRAIESYYRYTPGGRVPEYPRSLQDLLKDPRSPAVKRHLRRIYPNPISRDGKWEYVLDQRGAIKGVFAENQEQPTKKRRFPSGYESFEKASVYSDWKFVQGLGRNRMQAAPLPGGNPPVSTAPGTPQTGSPREGGLLK